MLVQSLVPNQIDILNFADVGWAKMMCPVLLCCQIMLFGAECHVISETFSHL